MHRSLYLSMATLTLALTFDAAAVAETSNFSPSAVPNVMTESSSSADTLSDTLSDTQADTQANTSAEPLISVPEISEPVVMSSYGQPSGFYVGASTSLNMMGGSTQTKSYNTGITEISEKGKRSKGLGYGAFAGYTFAFKDWALSTELGVERDASSMVDKNIVSNLGDPIPPLEQLSAKISRVYTVSARTLFSLPLGIDPSLAFQGLVGIDRSQFKIHYSQPNRANTVTSKKSVYGVSLGVGIEKSFTHFRVGMMTTYTHYQKLTVQKAYSIDMITTTYKPSNWQFGVRLAVPLSL